LVTYYTVFVIDLASRPVQILGSKRPEVDHEPELRSRLARRRSADLWHHGHAAAPLGDGGVALLVHAEDAERAADVLGQLAEPGPDTAIDD
jgi:hypothetical protein